MSSYHSRGRRALHRAAYGGARLLVLAVTFAPTLAGQGAKEVPRRGKASAPAAVTSHVGPARSVLGSLVGTWRFEIWFAGNFAGAPDASGTRVVKALFDDLHLEWTEQVDHSRIQGRGMVGFDLSSDRFFSASISDDSAAQRVERIFTAVSVDVMWWRTSTISRTAPGSAPIFSKWASICCWINPSIICLE